MRAPTLRHAALVLLAAALAGCAGSVSSSPRPVTRDYVKPGATATQVEQDRIDCAKLTTGSNQERLNPVLRIDRDAVDRCMRERGYALRLPE